MLLGGELLLFVGPIRQVDNLLVMVGLDLLDCSVLHNCLNVSIDADKVLLAMLRVLLFFFVVPTGGVCVGIDLVVCYIFTRGGEHA